MSEENITEVVRQQLLKLCDRATVDMKDWKNRDSCRAQEQIGACRALLLSNCPFKITHTDQNTITLEFKVKNFQWFEYSESDDTPPYDHENSFYVPTESRLDRANGEDWY